MWILDQHLRDAGTPMKRLLVLLVLAALVAVPAKSADGPATDGSEAARKVKSPVAPVYPDLARQLNITGTVKVRVVVDPEGRVVSAQEIGGHPLLIPAAMSAAKKFRFEPAPQQSTQIIQFKFGDAR